MNTILKEKYDQQKTIHIDDIITAAKNDDNLSIELIEEAVSYTHLDVYKRQSRFRPRSWR